MRYRREINLDTKMRVELLIIPQIEIQREVYSKGKLPITSNRFKVVINIKIRRVCKLLKNKGK